MKPIPHPGQLAVQLAYQASPLWTYTLPSTHEHGIASADWQPVDDAVQQALKQGSPAEVYGQLMAELRRTLDGLPTASQLGPAEKRAFGAFVHSLIQHYRAAAGA